MKCIKNRNTGDIQRVDDRLAETKVLTKTWGYTTKADWKKQKYGEYYQEAEKVREVLPANVEGTEEFNKANSKKDKNKKSKK